MGKPRFKKWLWEQCVMKVSHYHGKNCIFTADGYRKDCDDKGQTHSFSVVVSQHQNSWSERAIQTIMYMAWTFLVHISLHWKDRGADVLSLWYFAVKHLVWMYNWLPNKESELTPLEIMTRSKYDYCNLLCCHVWGFPVLFLEPKLQNDQKLSKFNQRALLVQFIGFSGWYSSLVANVQHISTGYIYPQFHLFFDDLLYMVICQGDDESTIEAIFSDIFI